MQMSPEQYKAFSIGEREQSVCRRWLKRCGRSDSAVAGAVSIVATMFNNKVELSYAYLMPGSLYKLGTVNVVVDTR